MITSAGFRLKTLSEILDEIRAAVRTEFGESIDLSPGNPMGQLVGIMAEREAEIWRLAQDVYSNQYPATSSERSLDDAVSLTGTRRRPATLSSVSRGVARGADGTTVPAGTVVTVQGNENARFVTQAAIEINIADGDTFKSEPVEMLAETTGEIAAPMGTLTNIVTPIAGMDSFTNEDAAITGRNLETDSELKIRRQQELSLAGTGTVEAIKSALSARELVTAVEIFQNNSALTVNNRPPHSVEILVRGDDVDALANAIFNLIGAGITMFGTTSRTITDSQGHQQTIRFSRPVEIPVFVSFTLSTDAAFPTDGANQVAAAVVEWGRDAEIGENVVLFGTNSLACVVDNIPGIIGLTVQIGKAADDLTSDNLVIAPVELPTFDADNVTVNIQ